MDCPCISVGLIYNEDTMENKSKIFVIAAIVIVIAGAGFWYWSRKKAATPKTAPALFSELSPEKAEDTLGSQILGKTQNPLKGELPPTNPFEKNETNPLKDVYVNPF